MKLFFAPRTRAVRTRWLLEELAVPYELVRLDPVQLPDDVKELSPFGELPVLVDGTETSFHSPSILLLLADRFADKGLAPALDSTARGDYVKWLLFAEAILDPLVVAFLPGSAGANRERLDVALGLVARRLPGRRYIAGEAFSAADVSLVSVLHLAHQLKLLGAHPILTDYTMAHAGRPATRKAVMG